MTWEISDRNREHRLALKIWAKPATVHGHGWSCHGMIRRSYTNSWFAKLRRLNLTSEWTISAVLLPDPLLNNELPNMCTLAGNNHVVHRLKHNNLAKESVPILKQKSKRNICSVGPERRSYSKPHITRIYVANESNMGFQEVSNILPIMPSCLFLTLLH
jgi:hypothetical protein